MVTEGDVALLSRGLRAIRDERLFLVAGSSAHLSAPGESVPHNDCPLRTPTAVLTARRTGGEKAVTN